LQRRLLRSFHSALGFLLSVRNERQGPGL